MDGQMMIQSVSQSVYPSTRQSLLFSVLVVNRGPTDNCGYSETLMKLANNGCTEGTGMHHLQHGMAMQINLQVVICGSRQSCTLATAADIELADAARRTSSCVSINKRSRQCLCVVQLDRM